VLRVEDMRIPFRAGTMRPYMTASAGSTERIRWDYVEDLRTS
jgi:hypothetical protein